MSTLRRNVPVLFGNALVVVSSGKRRIFHDKLRVWNSGVIDCIVILQTMSRRLYWYFFGWMREQLPLTIMNQSTKDNGELCQWIRVDTVCMIMHQGPKMAGGVFFVIKNHIRLHDTAQQFL